MDLSIQAPADAIYWDWEVPSCSNSEDNHPSERLWEYGNGQPLAHHVHMNTLGSPCELLSIYTHPKLRDRRPLCHPTLLGLAQKQVFEQVDSGLNLALHKLRTHVWRSDRTEKDLAVTCKVTPTFKSQRSTWTRTGGYLALGNNLFQAELTSLKIHN